MTGSEKTGTAGARDNLYEGRKVILSPHCKKAEIYVKTLGAFWEFLGSEVLVMSPEEHDHCVAWISHMPHLLIAAMVNAIHAASEKGITAGGESESSEKDNVSPFSAAGTGMRDISRLAASNPEMWRSIVMENIDAITDALKGMRGEIDELDKILTGSAEDEGEKLLEYFSRAKAIYETHQLGK